jgi:hypothetical protein
MTVQARFDMGLFFVAACARKSLRIYSLALGAFSWYDK